MNFKANILIVFFFTTINFLSSECSKVWSNYELSGIVSVRRPATGVLVCLSRATEQPSICCLVTSSSPASLPTALRPWSCGSSLCVRSWKFPAAEFYSTMFNFQWPQRKAKKLKASFPWMWFPERPWATVSKVSLSARLSCWDTYGYIYLDWQVS